MSGVVQHLHLGATLPGVLLVFTHPPEDSAVASLGHLPFQAQFEVTVFVGGDDIARTVDSGDGALDDLPALGAARFAGIRASAPSFGRRRGAAIRRPAPPVSAGSRYWPGRGECHGPASSYQSPQRHKGHQGFFSYGHQCRFESVY